MAQRDPYSPPTLDQFLEEDYGLEPLVLDETEEPEQAPAGFVERFGQSFDPGALAGLNQGGLAGGLISGFAGGLASRGQRLARRRAEVEALAEKRRAQRTADNIRATEDYRRQRSQAVAQFRKDRASKAEQEAREARESVAATPEMLRSMPWLARAGVKPGDPVPNSVAFQRPEATPREPLVQIQTPDGPRYVRQSDAVGKAPPAAAPKPQPVRGTDRKALGFFQRGREAVDRITQPFKNGKSLEETVANAGIISQGQLVLAPNWAKSSEQRRYIQAQRAFTEARLRAESGAAVPPQEYEADAQTYFAQPGDDPETIEQKRQAREEVLSGLANASGPAYEEYFGEPFLTPARGGQPAGPRITNDYGPRQAPSAVPKTWKRVQ